MQYYPTLILPEVQLQYGITPSSGLLRTDVGDQFGIYQQRNRFRSDLKTQDVQWTFNDLQFQYFQAWVYYKITLGADKFLIYLALGDGLQWYTARMVGATYKAKYNEGQWIVSAQLEIEDAVPA
jgi:hypothetical protein